MKLVLLASIVATTSIARSDDDPGMQLMTVMMRSPAISSDGKHVALYNEDPGTEKGAMTSLAIYALTGTVEQRISVVPPATDKAKAKAAAGKILKLLDDGGYKRMARVQQKKQSSKPNAYAVELASEDLAIDLRIADRKVSVAATKAGKKLPLLVLKLGPDGPCTAVDAYGIANTMAGYDPASGMFAFSVQAEHDKSICFAQGFVIQLK